MNSNFLNQILSAQIDPKEAAETLINQKKYDILHEALKSLILNDQKLLYAKKFFSSIILNFDKLTNDELQNLCESILANLSKKTAFEEEFLKIRENLSDVYIAKNEYLKAVKVLTEIRYNEINFLNSEKKLEKYVQISKLYFALDDPGYAVPWIEQSVHLKEECENETLILEFELIFAKHLDFLRKFLPAASFYYKCANKIQGLAGTDFNDVLEILSCSAICAILGAAGPQRSILLALLYKDDRLKNLEIFDILEKMYLNRIIKESEIQIFEKKIQYYHKAKTNDGLNALTKAIVEHNIIAVSQIYDTISLSSLANILKIDENITEKFLQSMIDENRLKADIDQISNFIEFKKTDNLTEHWNDNIHYFCSRLDKFLEKIVN